MRREEQRLHGQGETRPKGAVTPLLGHAMDVWNRQDDEPPQQQAGGVFREAQRSRVAQLGQRRNRFRDGGKPGHGRDDHPRQGNAVAPRHPTQNG